MLNTITTTDDLAALCTRLGEHDYITIDTEFMRESTYWPKLCLIQVASADEAAIIDPLAEGLSLDPLLALLRDEKTLKVFHAARQDLEIFANLMGEVPHPVFDTQVAAMVCGYGESVGYETLVNRIVKAQIDKSSRFTDWSRRPLSERQLTYAIGDVTHLRVIYENLARRLRESGRAGWLDEEMAQLLNIDNYIVKPENAWKRIKVRTTKPRFLALLQAAAAWRERECQKRNLPRNRIARDESLLEMAAHPPNSTEKLKKIRGFNKGLADTEGGRELIAALKEAAALPEEDCPVLQKPAPLPRGIGPVVDLLRVLLKARCEQADVAQKLVGNTADLEKLAAGRHEGLKMLHGWRYEVFGKDALDLTGGRIGLAAGKKGVRVFPLDEAAAE